MGLVESCEYIRCLHKPQSSGLILVFGYCACTVDSREITEVASEQHDKTLIAGQFVLCFW